MRSPKETIFEALTQCREQTLKLFTAIDRDLFSQQSHPDFSPMGWHLGHIAFTEAYWILEYLAGQQPLCSQYHKLFAADGLPKEERQNLPGFAVIKEYLELVRNKTLTYLETAPIEQQKRLWWWLLQHESQHCETITFVLQMHQLQRNNIGWYSDNQSRKKLSVTNKMTLVKAGELTIGNNGIEAQDNERPAHKIYLDNYWLDTYPVTCQQYQDFMIAGGYKKQQYWSDEGWQWLLKNPNISQPLYWQDDPQFADHPVCGVSYYEAEAYANFVGKRLPTEAEWEKAALVKTEKQGNGEIEEKTIIFDKVIGNYNRQIVGTTPVNAYPASKTNYGCYDMLGNVWEWTSSWFTGYEGFVMYPYPGYSQVYFDNQHRVLKGGSWATYPWALRASFRNWYHPWVRQIFAGFRCARDD